MSNTAYLKIRKCVHPGSMLYELLVVVQRKGSYISFLFGYTGNITLRNDWHIIIVFQNKLKCRSLNSRPAISSILFVKVCLFFPHLFTYYSILHLYKLDVPTSTSLYPIGFSKGVITAMVLHRLHIKRKTTSQLDKSPVHSVVFV